MKLISLIFIFSLYGCANYVNNMHRKISNQEKGIDTNRGGAPVGKQLNYYRTRQFDKKPIKDPITYSITPNQDLKPGMKRDYRTYKKRHTIDDIADNSPAPSLWANYTNTSNLFTTNKRKNQGDIVVLAVNKNMKEDISRELRKAFPKAPLRPILPNKSLASQKIDNSNQAPPQTAALPVKKEEDKEEAVIIFDKVSTRVAEEVGQDYILLKGRKEVYFRNKKRLVELHALTKRGSINSSDEIMSDKVTESKVFVIR